MDFIKVIFIRLGSLFLLKPFLKSKIFIFCFHDISEKSALQFSEHYSTETNNFLKQIDFIEKNFEIISINKIKDRNTLDKNKRYAIITFDDGFFSVICNAHPFLKEKIFLIQYS